MTPEKFMLYSFHDQFDTPSDYSQMASFLVKTETFKGMCTECLKAMINQLDVTLALFLEVRNERWVNLDEFAKVAEEQPVVVGMAKNVLRHYSYGRVAQWQSRPERRDGASFLQPSLSIHGV